MKKTLKDKSKKEALEYSEVKKVVVPDTSIIVKGIISNELSKKNLEFKKILIHEAVFSELESQANKGKVSGFLGLDEIKKIRDLSIEKEFEIEFCGSRPGDFEIKFAKLGEMDSLIRDLALKQDATLLTADLVQGKVAQAKGISVKFYDVSFSMCEKLLIEDFFSENTMSVHLREGCLPRAKVGTPRDWKYVDVRDSVLSFQELELISSQIIDFAKHDSLSFFESEKKNSLLIKLREFRVVIVRPPFSDVFEITVARSISVKNLKDYNLSNELKDKLFSEAKGLLVVGPLGHGKSTFVQSLANNYLSLNKVVKTLEYPRDLTVDKNITRYGSMQAQSSEIKDVLLLSGADFVLFDEIRNLDDFKLFSDLRLSGVGVLGVINASDPINVIQRFISRLDFGLILQVIDTLIFFSEGCVKKVFSLNLKVKDDSDDETSAMKPVLVISDFFSGKPVYEVRSYDGSIVVSSVK